MTNILPHQHLIPTGDLAEELGVDVNTLCRWTSESSDAGRLWRSCMLRKGWYSIPKLRAAGLLSEPEPQPSQTAQDASLRDDLIQLAGLCLTIAGKLKDEAAKR